MINLTEKLKTLKILHNGNYRIIDHVWFADRNYSVSIQANEYLHCTPRLTLPLEEYTHFEVMLNIPQKDVPATWIERYGNRYIYPNVPKDEIEKLLNTLDELYRMI